MLSRLVSSIKGNETMIRPRRSFLFMPGSNARALEKAKTLPADGFIFDLEDAVAPDAKQAARQQIADAVGSRAYGKCEILVRINGLDTAWWLDDVGMVAKAHPDGIVIPKVQNPDQLKAIADRLGNINAHPPPPVSPLSAPPSHLLRSAD